MGLFASRALPSGTAIDYTGDRVPLGSDADGGVYFLRTSTHVAVDAARTNSGQGRWVNDPRGTPLRANAEFRLHTPPGQQRRACVRTLRPIAKGEEILVRYGDAYWRYQGANGSPRRARAAARMATAPDEPRVANAEVGDGTVTVATTTHELSAAIKGAALADAAYAAQVASPPDGTEVHGGLLWRGAALRVPDDKALRTRILAELHDSVTGAHFGRDKVLAQANDRFSWDGMARDVELYVATCDACQRNKPSQQLTPGLLMPLPLPEAPCREWTQDAVTGLPKTRRGHDAIQVYVERLCKLKHFAAGRSTDGALELAASFRHHVIRAHGVPDRVVSDRDPRFTAKFYEEWSRLLGMKLSMSTARHAQTDGQSEREIKTLITALRAFCNEHQDDWDDYLDMLELGFNAAVQASTQRSPFELLHGEKARLPIDPALAPFAPKNPAAVLRAERMQQALQFVRGRLLSAQERQARNADRHRRPAAFAVGDAVLLSTDGLQLRNGSNKLCSRFIGPFTVTAVVNANAYTLRLPQQLQLLHPTVNIDKLKPYRDGRAAFPDRPQRYDRPPPEVVAESNGDERWEVERIVAQRRRGRGLQYLVAWKGYPPEEATWESRAALADAPDVLADWDQLQRRAAGARNPLGAGASEDRG